MIASLPVCFDERFAVVPKRVKIHRMYWRRGSASICLLASAGFELEFGVELLASTRNLASY